MSWIGAAVVGGSVLGGVIQGEAAKDASQAQVQSSEAAVEEQRRQFDIARGILQPYVDVGTPAVQEQQNILGLSGPEAQTSAYQAMLNSPEYQALAEAGEQGILQGASATGGLRGGNTQAALAEFRPQLLNQLIQQRFNNLGALTATGQASAAGQATGAQTLGTNVADLYTRRGDDIAESRLARGQAYSNIASAPSNIAILKSMGAF